MPIIETSAIYANIPPVLPKFYIKIFAFIRIALYLRFNRSKTM